MKGMVFKMYMSRIIVEANYVCRETLLPMAMKPFGIERTPALTQFGSVLIRTTSFV